MEYLVKVNESDYDWSDDHPIAIMPDLESAILLVYLISEGMLENAPEHNYSRTTDLEILPIGLDGDISTEEIFTWYSGKAYLTDSGENELITNMWWNRIPVDIEN